MSQFAQRDPIVKLEIIRLCSYGGVLEVGGAIRLFDDEDATPDFRHAEKFADGGIVKQHVVKRLPDNDGTVGDLSRLILA